MIVYVQGVNLQWIDIREEEWFGCTFRKGTMTESFLATAGGGVRRSFRKSLCMRRIIGSSLLNRTSVSLLNLGE